MTTILEQSDRVAGGVARAAATLGQMSLVALGVHLAADRLDDQLWDLLTALSDQLDATLSAPLARVADTFGLGFDTFLFWQSLPLPLIAATTCLLWELLADIMLWDAFLLTPRSTHVTWSKYRRSLSLRAIVLPITLTGVLLSGAWSLFMATEDILPTHDASSWGRRRRAAGIGPLRPTRLDPRHRQPRAPQELEATARSGHGAASHRPHGLAHDAGVGGGCPRGAGQS